MGPRAPIRPPTHHHAQLGHRPDWQVTADLTRTSTVEVTFHAEEDNRTRVILLHRDNERHGPGWETLRDGLQVPGGWPLHLARCRDLTGERDSDEQA